MGVRASLQARKAASMLSCQELDSVTRTSLRGMGHVQIITFELEELGG